MRRAEEGAAFGYSGVDGPRTWLPTEVCQAGEFQSPIDFIGEALTSPTNPKVQWQPIVEAPFNIVNNGHTVQVNVPEDKLNLMATDQIDGQQYTLRQFHFHSPSEHHIDGKYFPLEVHFVHMNAANQINVVGALFDFSDNETNPFLNVVENAFPTQKDTSMTISRMDLTFAKDFLAASPFYTYSGSLTTPPCSEGVLWTVAKKPMPITMAQFRKVQQAIEFNARLVQNNKGATAKIVAAAGGKVEGGRRRSSLQSPLRR
ncbi:alpha carbonic anhydrase [Chytridium lagenaria]|nr:alpha carbonic anhydrase [Chytridium lagenaria]